MGCGVRLVKSQAALKLYMSLNSTVQRTKQVNETAAWRKHVREQAGLELTKSITVDDVRIDAVEWKGFKDAIMKTDSSATATIDVVSGDHDNGANGTCTIDEHREGRGRTPTQMGPSGCIITCCSI